MTKEASKSMRRRNKDKNFWRSIFRGKGVDIGAGDDCIDSHLNLFPAMNSVRNWDLKDGDAQYMASVEDETYDFVHSSHCLEHMVDPYIAIENWLRIIKTNGYVVVTIPDEIMYEKEVWPSQFNEDHKWSWRIGKETNMPKSIYLPEFLDHFKKNKTARIERCVRLTAGWNPNSRADQTYPPNGPECAIEFVLQKRKVK
jgi:SAM-dependent methyltransferase